MMWKIFRRPWVNTEIEMCVWSKRQCKVGVGWRLWWQNFCKWWVRNYWLVVSRIWFRMVLVSYYCALRKNWCWLIIKIVRFCDTGSANGATNSQSWHNYAFNYLAHLRSPISRHAACSVITTNSGVSSNSWYRAFGPSNWDIQLGDYNGVSMLRFFWRAVLLF